jgi:ABC-type glycerol-3-phosphate transport system permease component
MAKFAERHPRRVVDVAVKALPGLVNPFGVYLMRIVWGQGVENDLIEASRLDGASETRIFFRIGLPLVTTGLTTLGLLSFVGAWNNLFWPLIVASDERLYPTPDSIGARVPKRSTIRSISAMLQQT